jgi:hypothetical protein
VEEMKKENNTNKQIPLGIKIISIFFFAIAIFGLLASVFMIVETMRGNYHTLNLATMIFLILFLILATFGCFMLGVGLRKGDQVAYFIMMICSFFSAGGFFRLGISKIALLPTEPLHLISRVIFILVSLLIFIYLVFNKKVQKFFNYSLFSK